MRQKAENGFAIIALVAVILVLGLVAYSFMSIISTQRYASSAQPISAQAFYLAESGLEIGKKYYSDFWRDTAAHSSTSDEPVWASTTYYFLYQSEPLGNGSFDLGVKWLPYDPQYRSFGYMQGAVAEEGS